MLPTNYFPEHVSFSGSRIKQRRFSDLCVTETLYRPSQKLPWHSHASSYISVVLRGSYTEQYGSSSVDLGPGHVILHVSGESHSNVFHQQGGWLLNLELSHAFWSRLAEDDGVRNDTRRIVHSPFALHLGVRIQKELSSANTGSAWATEGLLMELVAEVIRDRSGRTSPGTRPWLDEVEEILRERYRDPLTLKELGELVSVHPVHLARVFRNRHKCSVGDFLRKLRVEAACRQLVESEASIAEVAQHAGFSDQSHLCRLFKQHTGMSPRRFRESLAPGQTMPVN
jgi:AraC family transcriptional regulator